MREFSGKVAVVTGAASGIGLALAERFAKEGMKLVLGDVEQARLTEVASDFEARGVPVAAAHVDVAEGAAIESLAVLADKRFGGTHILCNNAGVAPAGRFRPVWEYPVEDWRWAFDVNMMGVVHGLRSFIPRMLVKREPAHIVNTASIAGLLSGAGSPLYSTTKHAVVRISEALYASLQERKAPIGVTVLCPGVVQTRIYESERNRPKGLMPAAGIAAEPKEVHEAIVQLRPGGLTADGVADMVWTAVREEQFYVLTTDQFDEAIRARFDCVMARRNPVFADLLTLTQAESANRLKRT